MTWKQDMTKSEAAEYARLEAERASTADAFREYRLKVKSRCEWRAKQRKRNDG